MRRAPHPVFSPELAPTDFYLFGTVKTALLGSAFSNEDELLQGITEVLSNIPPEQLEAAFENWLVRLDKCIQQQGEYVE
jgi:histone-lysine N-methyltransferase SETMAR